MLDTRLEALEQHLTYVHRDLRELIADNAYAVGLLGQKVDMLRFDVFVMISELGQRDLRPLHLRRDRDTMDERSFRETMDRLWTWAIQNARDRLETGPDPALPAQVTKHDDALFLELRRQLGDVPDPWRGLTTLRAVAPLFGRSLGDARQCNPVVWAVCTDDYIALATRWPSLYAGYDRDLSKLAALLTAGDEVRLVVGRITTRDDGQPDPAFLLALIDAYRGRVGRLGEFLARRMQTASDKFGGVNPFTSLPKESDKSFIFNSDLPHRDLPAMPGFAPSRPMVQGKVTHVTSNDGVRFWSGFSPNDPNNVPDPKATLEVGLIPLSPELRAKLAGLIPAEVQAAERMALGRLRVGYSLAGLCDEVYVADPHRNPGSIPAEIRQHFKFLVDFTVPVRWGRIGLVWKAEFLAKNGARLPIYSLKTVSPQYYSYHWHRDNGFQLADSDLAGAQFLSLQARFNALVPHFGQELLKGAATETDPEGSKTGRAAVLALIAQAQSSKQEILRAETDAFRKPGGELRLLLEEIDGARALVVPRFKV